MVVDFDLFSFGLLFKIILGLVSLVVVTALFLFFKFYVWTQIKMKHYKKQGASCYFFPMIGHFHKMIGAFEEHGDFYYYSKRKARDDPDRIMCSNMAGSPYILLHDPALIKEFCLNTDNYVKEPLILDLFAYLLGVGLVIVEGNQWKTQKKMLSSSFHFEFLNSILPNIQKLAFQRFSDLGKDPLKDVDIMTMMQNISGEIVGKLFFGDELDNYRFEGKKLTDALSDLITEAFTSGETSERYILGLWLTRLIPKHRRMINKIYKFRNACIGFVEERKKVLEQNKGKKDMVQILLEYDGEGGKITESNVVDQFISFFLPGLDTSGHLLTMSIYYMAKYPEFKTKIEEEVEKYYTQGKPITIEELNKFDYTTAFLKEVLRTSSPLNDMFARRAVRDHMIKDIHIKKGDVLNVDYYYNNYNPEYFKNPDEFDPQRWLSKEKGLDPYVFTPFSAGPRSCIGQHLAMNEVKVILCELLKMFDFKLKEGYVLKMTVRFLYGPAEPILLDMTPKSSK